MPLFKKLTGSVKLYLLENYLNVLSGSTIFRCKRIYPLPASTSLGKTEGGQHGKAISFISRLWSLAQFQAFSYGLFRPDTASPLHVNPLVLHCDCSCSNQSNITKPIHFNCHFSLQIHLVRHSSKSSSQGTPAPVISSPCDKAFADTDMHWGLSH